MAWYSSDAAYSLNQGLYNTTALDISSPYYQWGGVVEFSFPTGYTAPASNRKWNIAGIGGTSWSTGGFPLHGVFVWYNNGDYNIGVTIKGSDSANYSWWYYTQISAPVVNTRYRIVWGQDNTLSGNKFKFSAYPFTSSNSQFGTASNGAAQNASGPTSSSIDKTAWTHAGRLLLSNDVSTYNARAFPGIVHKVAFWQEVSPAHAGIATLLKIGLLDPFEWRPDKLIFYYENSSDTPFDFITGNKLYAGSAMTFDSETIATNTNYVNLYKARDYQGIAGAVQSAGIIYLQQQNNIVLNANLVSNQNNFFTANLTQNLDANLYQNQSNFLNFNHQNTQQFFTATTSPTTVVISATAANQTNGFSTVQSWLTEDWPEADYTIYIDGTVEENLTVSITLNDAKWGQGSLIIQSAPGQHHRGKPGSGAVWKMTSNRIFIQAGNTGNELIIQDLDIDWNNTTASSQSGISIVNTGPEYTRIRRCIVRNHVCPIPNQSGAGVITEGTSSGNIEICNNLVFNNKVTLGGNFSGQAYAAINMGGHNNGYNFKIYNNTVYGTGTTGSGAINNCEVYGIRSAGDDNEDSYYNNIVQNVTNGSTGTGTIAACYNSTITSGVNILTGGNISDDTSSPQSTLRNITVDFVDTANDNYHLADTTNNHTYVIGKASSSGIESDDIDGSPRATGAAANYSDSGTSWDIGADEFRHVALIAASGGDWTRIGRPVSSGSFMNQVPFYSDWVAKISGTVSETETVATGSPNIASLTITSNDGEKHNGTAGSGAILRYTGSGTPSFISVQTPCIIKDIEIDGNSTVEINNLITNQSNYVNLSISRCIIHGLTANENTNVTQAIFIANDLNNNIVTVEDNIIYDIVNSGTITTRGIFVSTSNSTVPLTIRNNTIYGIKNTNGTSGDAQGINFNNDRPNVYLYNNIVQSVQSTSGTPTAYSSSAFTNINHGGNIADDTSSPDSLNSITVDFVNTTSGSEDFHITNSTNNQTNVIGQGDTTIDLLGYRDIDGDYRSNVTPDIGADEYDQFFVNQNQFFTATMSPTTVVIGTSHAYTTFTAWLSEDWPSADYTLLVDGTVTESTAVVQFDKSYLNGNSLLIKPVDGQEHKGIPGFSAKIEFTFTAPLDTAGFYIGKSNSSTNDFDSATSITIQDLEFTQNGGAIYHVIQLAPRITVNLYRLLIHDFSSYSGGSQDAILLQAPNEAATDIKNIMSCIIYNLTNTYTVQNFPAAVGITRLFGTNTYLYSGVNWKIENNTIYNISASLSFSQAYASGISLTDKNAEDSTGQLSTAVTIRNNIVQNISAYNNNGCYSSRITARTDSGVAGNISDDATSPDTAFRNIDLTFRALDATNNPDGTIAGHYVLEETDTAAMGQASVGSMPTDVKGADRWRYSNNDLPQTSISNITSSGGSTDVTVTAAGHNLSVGGWITVHGTGSSNFDSSPGTPKYYQVTAVSGNDITYTAETDFTDTQTTGTLTQIVWDIGADQYRHKVVVGQGTGTVTNEATDYKWTSIESLSWNDINGGLPFVAHWRILITGDALTTGANRFTPSSTDVRFTEGLCTAYPGEEANGLPYDPVLNPNVARVGRDGSSSPTGSTCNTPSIRVPHGKFTWKNLFITAEGQTVLRVLTLGMSAKKYDGTNYATADAIPRSELINCVVAGQTISSTSVVNAVDAGNASDIEYIIAGNIVYGVTNNTGTSTNPTVGIHIQLVNQDRAYSRVYNNTVTNITTGSGSAYGISCIGSAGGGFDRHWLYNNLVTNVTHTNSGTAPCFRQPIYGGTQAGYNLSDDDSALDLDTPTFSISNITGNSGNGTVSVTTTASHGYSNGDRIVIAETTNFNGSFIISNASGTTFDYSNTNSNSDETSGTTRKTTSIHYATITFRDAANDDYHLASTDTDALEVGTVFTEDNVNITQYQDIDGDYRSNVTPDIGADEYDQFFVNQNQFFTGSISVQTGIDLDAALYQNAQQFFTAELTQNLNATLYVNNQNYFTAELTQNLDAALYTNSQNYFTAELTQNLDAALYTNNQNYFTAELSFAGKDLDAALYTNNQNYFTAELTQNLDASLYLNNQNYFTAELSQNLDASLYPNNQNYFTAELTQNLDAALYVNNQNYFKNNIITSLVGKLYTNNQNYYTADLIQNLNADLYINSQSYFQARTGYRKWYITLELSVNANPISATQTLDIFIE